MYRSDLMVSPMTPVDATLSPISTADGATPFNLSASRVGHYVHVGSDRLSTNNVSSSSSVIAAFRRPDDLVMNIVSLSQSLSPSDPLRGVFDAILGAILSVQDLEDSRRQATEIVTKVTVDETNQQQPLFSILGAADAAMMSSGGRDSEVARPQGQALVRADIQSCQQGLRDLEQLEEKVNGCKMIDLDSGKVLSVMEEQKRQAASCIASLRSNISSFTQQIDAVAQEIHSQTLADVTFARQRAQGQELKFSEKRDALALRTAQKVEGMQTRLKGIAANCIDTNGVLLHKISRLDEYDDRVIAFEKERTALKEQVSSLMTLLAEVNNLFRQCAVVPCMEGKLRQATVRQEESQKLFKDLSQELERPSSPKTRPPPPPSPVAGPAPIFLGHAAAGGALQQQQPVIVPHGMNQQSFPAPLRLGAVSVRPSAGPARLSAVKSRPAASGPMPKRQRSPEQQFHPSAEAGESKTSGGFFGKVFGFVKRIAEHAAELPPGDYDDDDDDDDDDDEDNTRSGTEPRSDDDDEDARRATKKLRGEQASSPSRSQPTTAAGHAVAALAEARRNHIESMRQAVAKPDTASRASTALNRDGASEQLSPPRLSLGMGSDVRTGSTSGTSGAFTVRPSPALRRTPFLPVTAGQVAADASSSPVTSSQQSETDHGSQFSLKRVESVEYLGTSQPPRKQ